MRKKLFNLITIILFIIGIASAGYLAIPIEWQEKYIWLADINGKIVAITALISSTGVVGALLFLQSWVLGREKLQDIKYDKSIDLSEKVINRQLDQDNVNAERDKRDKRMEQSILRMEKFIIALVNSKLENPFLTPKTQEELEEVKEEIDSEVIADVEE